MTPMPVVESKRAKWVRTLLFVPPLLLLVVYPAVLIANIMSLAAVDSGTGEATSVTTIFFSFFLFLTTVYPVVVLGSFFLSRRAPTTKRKNKWLFTVYAYLITIVVVFLLAS